MIFRENLRWGMLKPAGFLDRQAGTPVVHLPMGLREPHGHVAPSRMGPFRPGMDLPEQG